MTLFIHTANLGDVVSSVAVIKGVARQSPVEVLLRKSFRGLFAGEENIVEVSEAQLRPHYDQVIDLDSSKVSRRIVEQIESPEKIGRYLNWVRRLKYSSIYSRQVPKHAHDHIVKDYSPVAETLGLNPLAIPHLKPLPFSSELGLWWQKNQREGSKGDKWIIVHGEASNPIRSLPEEMLISYIQQGIARNQRVLLIGEPSSYLESVLAKVGEVVIHRSFTIAELKSILPLAETFIGPDSGPLHLAAALGVKCIGIYGPTLPRQYAPLSPSLEVVEKEFSCRPCNQNRPCRFERRCLH